MKKTYQIVILGGGFSGVYTAKSILNRAKRFGISVEVHIINRDNYMTFQPMLPEIIGGSIDIADSVSPIRSLVPKASLHLREIEAIDLTEKKVLCAPSYYPQNLELHYDYLVIALGNESNLSNMKGLAEHAFPFKTLSDAVRIKNHLIQIIEEADMETSPSRKKELLSFVVSGGGFSGVELIAELQCFIQKSIKNFSRISLEECSFNLIHSKKELLLEMHPHLRRYTAKILKARGINLLFEKRLAGASHSYAILNDQTLIPTKTIIATVPNSTHHLIDKLDVPKERGKILCNSSCQVQEHPHLWALGDCALVPVAVKTQEKSIYATPTAQYAIREGKLCGENILAHIQNKSLKKLTFKGLGSLASLGRRQGVAEILGFKTYGLIAWILWRSIYWIKMPGIDRKIRVGIRWFLDLFIPADIVQISLKQHKGIFYACYEKDEYIFKEGDIGGHVYIIAQGRVSIIKQNKTVAELNKGQYFGEVALIEHQPRNASVLCLEHSEFLCIEKEFFLHLIRHLDNFKSDFTSTAKERS